ncbi:hypothetical protein ACCO45_005836 [Purpureocillium lilacinum]|uniref:Uncharacterized protein n=1 Tax=Purpureocillium lilacinum TaxID=33203 RepID=A0ACC4DYV5_PURLI
MDDDDLAGDDLESILKHGAQALFDENYQATTIHYDGPSVDKLLDRSQMEQTKADEEGSADTQFTYARVWANERQGFDDGLDTVEDEAPVPINSSAINYKTNAALEGIPLPEGVEPESSDSSDEFAGAESADESEDEDLAAKDGDLEDALEAVKPASAGGADSSNATKPKRAKASESKNSSDTNSKKPKGTEAGRSRRGHPGAQEVTTAPLDANQGDGRSKSIKARYRNGTERGQGGSSVTAPGPGQPWWFYGDAMSGGNGIPGYYYHPAGGRGQQQPLPSLMSGGTYGFTPNASFAPAAPARPTTTQRALADNVPNMYLNRSLSEAELRLAIDELRHSPSDPAANQQKISTLLHQLRVLRMQVGPAKR